MQDYQRRQWGARFSAPLRFLETQLDSLTTTAVWRVLALSMGTIALGDYLVHWTGVDLGPLYMLPIYLAAWRLSFMAAIAVALLSALLSVGVSILATGDWWSFATFGNLALHMVTLPILAGIVTSFRYSYERERFFARRDGITGALTRQAFEQQAQAMIEAAAIRGRPLLLAYLDFDGFKAVNDRHGHDAGDQVLRRFGIEGRAVLRREDCFGRLGGDEFALLLQLPTIEEAQETAGGLHGRFTAALANTAHEVTCSMGALAIPPDAGTGLDELLRGADRLMYAAKHGGKDSLRFATAAPPVSPSLPWPILPMPLGEASEVAGSV